MTVLHFQAKSKEFSEDDFNFGGYMPSAVTTPGSRPSSKRSVRWDPVLIMSRTIFIGLHAGISVSDFYMISKFFTCEKIFLSVQPENMFYIIV